MAACKRCGGLGRLPEHAHYLSGTCFTCHGTGSRQPPTDADRKRWARRAAEKRAIREALIAAGLADA